MQNTIAMSWTDWRGKEHVREVNQLIDVRDFLGTPGYSMLLVAANTHLSAPDLKLFLEAVSQESEDTKWVNRTLTWIKKRRWMFQKPGTVNTNRCDVDGKQARAVCLMNANPKLSNRALERLLNENGIIRSRDWIRQHRCDKP